MGSVLVELLGIMVEGISTLATGVAGGVVVMAKALFLEEVTGSSGTTYQLSIFGGLIGIFAGIGLATTITTRVYIWCTSLGN